MNLRALPWGIATFLVLVWTFLPRPKSVVGEVLASEEPSISLYPEPGERRRYLTVDTPTARFDLTRFGIEVLPLSLGAQNGSAILVIASGEVMAIDLLAARIRWVLSRNRLGFEPRAVAAVDSVTVHVLPSDRDVYVRVQGRDGAPRTVNSPRSGEIIQNICPLVPERLLLTFLTANDPIWVSDTAGRVLWKAHVPWAALHRAHPIQTQMASAADLDTGVCVLALRAGGGFAVFSSSGVQTYPYVTPVPIGGVTTTRYLDSTHGVTTRSRYVGSYAASDIAAAGGYVWIPTGEGVDAYSSANGKYLATFRFNHQVSRLSAAGNTILISAYEQGIPTLWQYRNPLYDGVRRTR